MSKDEKNRAPEPTEPTQPAADEDDVEGHSFLPTGGYSRDMARARERDVQRQVQRHTLEMDARRPHKRDGK